MKICFVFYISFTNFWCLLGSPSGPGHLFRTRYDDSPPSRGHARTTGDGRSRFVDVQNQRFTHITCGDCGYTEFFKKTVSTADSVLDLASSAASLACCACSLAASASSAALRACGQTCIL